MKRILAACLLALVTSVPLHAEDDSRDLLDKAIDDLVNSGYLGDTSAAERYLEAVLEQQPENLEARWQALLIRIKPVSNAPLAERVGALSVVSPEFADLITLARKSKQEAFAHYLTAMHAGLYHAYDRALPEIDRAVALEPRSARYRTAKGRLQLDRGKWTRNDDEIEKGIRTLNEARESLRQHPSPFLRDPSFDFTLASAYIDFSQPRWKEAAAHYQRFIDATQPSVLRAFALNNMSSAYVKLGECARAKEAAEQALAFMKFGMAEWNKRQAEFCLEMQKTDRVARQ